MSFTAEERERAQRMAAEIDAMRRRGQCTLTFGVDLFDLFRVIGCLQLAYRHPGLEPEMRAVIQGFASELEMAFDPDEAPELYRTLEEGWDPQYDR